jgi:hypothetical protein
MTDARQPLWEKEESIEAAASPAFAFRYWMSVENMAADPGIERVETDGPYRDRPGMCGTTHLVGGGEARWVVAEVDPGRRVAIEVPLRDSILRFDLRVDEAVGGGSVLTQRVSLFGPNAVEHLAGVEAGFATSLRDGMRAVRDRIDEAAVRRRSGA